MSIFKQLELACQRLEDTLDSAIVGAVPCTGAGHFDEDTERWEKVIIDKLNEIKLLNSKAILVTASIQKDNQPTSGVTPDAAQLILSKAMDTRLRWGNALKTMAASQAVRNAFQERRQADMVVASELLLKLSSLQKTLDMMDSQEAEKEKELTAAIHKWHQASLKYKEVSSNPSASTVVRDDKSETDSHLYKLINKIEILSKITSRMMAVFMTRESSYDWTKDNKSLLKILTKTRRHPFTPECFL